MSSSPVTREDAKNVGSGDTPTASEVTSAGLALAHKLYAAAPKHVPNAKGEPYKTELVIERDPNVKTVKVNWWHLPDDDRDPHSHPWDFKSTILAGGYEEIRYWVDKDGKVQHEKFSHAEGDVNEISRDSFHLVVAVKPETVTYMECNHANPDNAWGYLDIIKGEKRPADPDETFMQRFQYLNRFMIKDPSNRPPIDLTGFPFFPPRQNA